MATSTTQPAASKKSGGYTHFWILVGVTIVLAIIAAALGVQLKAPGFLGTRATLGAGLVVIAEAVMLAMLWYGRSLAKKKDFYHHQRLQTSVMLFNLVAIGFVMIVTFAQQIVGPGAIPGDPAVPLAIAHGIGGALLEVLGLYIVVRMWFEKLLPNWFKARNFKLLMQITLYGWTLIVISGVAIFALRYLASPASSTAATGPSQAHYNHTETSVPTTSSEVIGSAGIRDDRTHSDSVLITLQNVLQPPAGNEYVGWLIGNDGAYRLNLGVLKVDADGKINQQYISPSGTNLLALYDEFLITIEQAGVPHKAPANHIAFSVVVPSKARQPLQQLLVTAPDTPFHTGYLLDLLLMARRVDDHARLAQKFADKGDLTGIRRQAEAIANIMEGEQGQNFGDLDNDGRILNDGDSIGIFPRDIDKVKEVAQAAIDASDATPPIKLHAGHTIIGMNNARVWAEQLDAQAVKLAHTTDLAAAQSLVLDVGSLSKKMLEGVDLDNDESIDPVKGEGTIVVAYKHAQFAASPVYQAPLSPGGAPLNVDEVTPTPQAGQPPAPTSNPKEVVVLIQDFAFAQPSLNIKVGTRVTWVNRDNSPHTVTFDDGSFDSGTLDTGQSTSFTFSKAGEFPYYCQFHGGPGGIGMAAKVVVTP